MSGKLEVKRQKAQLRKRERAESFRFDFCLLTFAFTWSRSDAHA